MEVIDRIGTLNNRKTEPSPRFVTLRAVLNPNILILREGKDRHSFPIQHEQSNSMSYSLYSTQIIAMFRTNNTLHMLKTIESFNSPYTLLQPNTIYLRADVSTERDGLHLSSGNSGLRVNDSEVNLAMNQITGQSP